jgi:hypothetical protein
MIVIKETGRFGNQLFQLNFCLNLLKKNEKIIFLGFKDLFKFVKKDNCFIFFDYKSLISKIFFILIKISKKFNLINFIIEDDKNKILQTTGLFSKITFINGYFESEKYVNKKIFLQFKPMKQEVKALKFISNLKKRVNSKIFFVHIRLMDQLVGCFKEASSELPLTWYFKCKKILRKKFKNVKFIYLSDDLNFLKDNFKKDLFIKSRDKYYNFYIMKNCDGGILSPSTFSWWAAFLSNKNSFYAPEYWHGHKKKIFFPKHMRSTFIKYIPVLKKEYLKKIKNESKFYKSHYNVVRN